MGFAWLVGPSHKSCPGGALGAAWFFLLLIMGVSVAVLICGCCRRKVKSDDDDEDDLETGQAKQQTKPTSVSTDSRGKETVVIDLETHSGGVTAPSGTKASNDGMKADHGKLSDKQPLAAGS